MSTPPKAVLNPGACGDEELSVHLHLLVLFPFFFALFLTFRVPAIISSSSRVYFITRSFSVHFNTQSVFQLNLRSSSTRLSHLSFQPFHST